MEPDDPPRKHYGLKARQFEHLNAPDKAPEKSTEHDVFAMLEQNRSVEKSLGKDRIEIVKVTSRRKRDYWQVLIGGNLLIIGIVAIARFNPISLLFGFSGVIILTLSLTWVMWFVMDDY
jgi:hypothetical protein